MFLMMATKVEAALLPVLENGTVTGEVPVSGNVIGQTFRAPTDTFGAVQIKFNTHRLEETTSLLFRIKEIGSDVWLYEGERNPADFYNRAYYPFGFPVVTGALGKSYYFEAEFKGETESLLAVLVNENEYPDGNLRLNDEDVIDLDLAFRVDEAAGVGKVIEAMQKDMGNKISSQAGFFLGYAGLMALVLAGSTVLYLWMNG
jgi:hypothetical protein